MTNLLGALGYTLLRISYLKFLRRLAAKLGAKAPGGANFFDHGRFLHS